VSKKFYFEDFRTVVDTHKKSFRILKFKMYFLERKVQQIKEKDNDFLDPQYVRCSDVDLQD
jgi:hypothetical protein